MLTKVGLTGSQFFGSKGTSSDFDFYIQDSPQARANLLSEGYRELNYKGTCGPNIVAIFRQGEGPGHVDVAMCTSFGRKHFENRMMTLTPLRLLNRFGPKTLRRAAWRVVQRVSR